MASAAYYAIAVKALTFPETVQPVVLQKTLDEESTKWLKEARKVREFLDSAGPDIAPDLKAAREADHAALMREVTENRKRKSPLILGA